MDTKNIQKHHTEQTPVEQTQAEYYSPAVDVLEDQDAFVLTAEVPGIQTSDVNVHFDNGTITLEAKVKVERPQENRNYLLREYSTGNYRRSFTIDTPVNSEAIKAELKNGLLTVRVPKAESVKTRKIAVQAG